MHVYCENTPRIKYRHSDNTGSFACPFGVRIESALCWTSLCHSPLKVNCTSCCFVGYWDKKRVSGLFFHSLPLKSRVLNCVSVFDFHLSQFLTAPIAKMFQKRNTTKPTIFKVFVQINLGLCYTANKIMWVS